jgi:hypothetical protein
MNLRTRVLVAGGIAGALLGVVAATLYMRSASEGQEEAGEQLPSVQPASVLAVVLAVLTVLRQIAGLGQRGDAGQHGR